MHLASPSRTIKQKAFEAVRCAGSAEINTQHRTMHTSRLGSAAVPGFTEEILNCCCFPQLKKYSSVEGAANKVTRTETCKKKECSQDPVSPRGCQHTFAPSPSPIYPVLNAHAFRWQRGFMNAAERDLSQHAHFCCETTEKGIPSFKTNKYFLSAPSRKGCASSWENNWKVGTSERN